MTGNKDETPDDNLNSFNFTTAKVERSYLPMGECAELLPNCQESYGLCVAEKTGRVYCECRGPHIQNPSKTECILNEDFCPRFFQTCLDTGGKCELYKRKVRCKCSEGKIQHPTRMECIDICELQEVKEKCNERSALCQRDDTAVEGYHCVCKDGEVMDADGACRECDCGVHAVSCSFQDGNKRCECEEDYKPQEGKCQECDCGDNSASCHFTGKDKICGCDEGFVDINGLCKEKICEEVCGVDVDVTCEHNGTHTECLCDHPKQFDYDKKKCKGCKCSDGKCVTDNRGNVKCVCPPGHAHQDEFTCKPCDCGSKGKCIFTLQPKSGGSFNYEKKCICDLGSAEKDGKCIDCYCGDNSACEFNGEEKNCYCIEGYSERKGVCTKCDCGFYGKCEFERGNKKCECDSGYLEYDGTCEECDCGENSLYCGIFDGGFKKCVCKEKYEERYGKCEECDCGDRGTCSFWDGAKYCSCENGFRENAGKCEECNCGANSVDCRYSHGVKECDCKEKFSDRAGICQECDCGPNSVACSFEPYQQICKCSKGYVQKGSSCEAGCSYYKPCQNGGICIDEFCKCLQGTRGEVCEDIDECDRLCPKQHDIRCTYDITRQEPICECLHENLRFDPERRQCHNTCNERARCRNGGICTPSGFCKCRVGTEGDFCDNIPECRFKDCGTEANCTYDVAEDRAVCQCKNEHLSFDSRNKQCKETCRDDATCKNNGKCNGISNLKFCHCLEGTVGQFCEDVVGCSNMDCGTEAVCVYDVSVKNAACFCKDQSLKFDDASRKCKRGCTVDDECKNGGTCTSKGFFGRFCDCLPGTGGDWCETVDDCREGRIECKGDAYCVFDMKRRKGDCECSDHRKRYDILSENCKMTCYEDATCHNGGLCMHRGDHLFCECKVGTSGNLCETVEDCQRGLCGYASGVECVFDVAKEAAVCKCRNPETLFDPASKTCKACDCGGNSISCRYEDGRKVCVCQDGYDVRNGTCQKVKCTERSCHNGKCQVIGEKEVCSCYEGYTLNGDYCQKLNCSKTPCINGTCVVRHGYREECVCQAGYTLDDGACIRGACRMDTCFGGTCKIIDGELMCVCPKNYSLQGIGCFATVCRKYHCFGGWCVVNEDKEEICTCHEGYILVNDVCKKILCNKPCFGGQCKFIDGKEECICPPGYSIVEDVCVR